MRPVDAYWLRKKIRGEIPAELTEEAQAVLRAALIPTEAREHPALEGLRHGFLSRRIVEFLLEEGEATATQIAVKFRMPKGTARVAIDNLVKGGRIMCVRTEERRHPGGRFVENFYVPVGTEALLERAAREAVPA